jgi:hypothetical protein
MVQDGASCAAPRLVLRLRRDRRYRLDSAGGTVQTCAMPLLLIPVVLGVFACLWWRHRFTTLTRDCRWRRDRAAAGWRCAACGARTGGEDTPRACLRRIG